MNMHLDPSNIIKKAGAKVLGRRYQRLRAICESQSTISTRKLLRRIEDFEKSECQDAIQLRDIADYIRRAQKQEHP